ncbi:Uma2 family endonuclease [Jiangella sp. DSM 45060]|uniref:Uma2 family endonuclease n=1 Tax=Jiangella sp. DSM 45060 TaxID=1798224 RepID=UPI00087C76A3|nr:Uma2 family endonuclease [Jiangella sp. DSM 45060]SDT62590.1 Endonuclease, Uma2 family (restriction endonuclease fold) [Jiangella sp. DSM 45060]
MMTIAVPDHLVTVEEWDALEDVNPRMRYELVDGNVVLSPRPALDHQDVIGTLVAALRKQRPPGHRVLPEPELAIDLGPWPTIRVPDVVVSGPIDSGAQRVGSADAKLVVEVVSPGSRRTDRVAKLSEYQDVGIPAYWIIDPAAVDDSRFVAYELVGGAYKEVARGSGVVSLERPFPVSIDVDELLTLD